MSRIRIGLSDALKAYVYATAGGKHSSVGMALLTIHRRGRAEEEITTKRLSRELAEIATVKVEVSHHPIILALMLEWCSVGTGDLFIDPTDEDGSLTMFMLDSVDFTTPADAIPKEAYTYNVTVRAKNFYIGGKVFPAPGHELIKMEYLPPLDLSPTPDLYPARGTERRYRLKQIGFTYTSEYRALLTTGERGIIQTIREQILSGQCQEEIK